MSDYREEAMTPLDQATQAVIQAARGAKKCNLLCTAHQEELRDALMVLDTILGTLPSKPKVQK